MHNGIKLSPSCAGAERLLLRANALFEPFDGDLMGKSMLSGGKKWMTGQENRDCVCVELCMGTLFMLGSAPAQEYMYWYHGAIAVVLPTAGRIFSRFSTLHSIPGQKKSYDTTWTGFHQTHSQNMITYKHHCLCPITKT